MKDPRPPRKTAWINTEAFKVFNTSVTWLVVFGVIGMIAFVVIV